MKKTNKLTYKQDLVIKDVVAKVSRGKPMGLRDSVMKFYDVKNVKNANNVINKNMHNPTFREALISSLLEKRVLGADSKTEGVLLEGLEATDKEGNINYDARLKYVQEINKIAGVYAPETKKTLNLNMDVSEEELDKRIQELQEQLE